MKTFYTLLISVTYHQITKLNNKDSNLNENKRLAAYHIKDKTINDKLCNPDSTNSNDTKKMCYQKNYPVEN